MKTRTVDEFVKVSADPSVHSIGTSSAAGFSEPSLPYLNLTTLAGLPCLSYLTLKWTTKSFRARLPTEPATADADPGSPSVPATASLDAIAITQMAITKIQRFI